MKHTPGPWMFDDEIFIFGPTREMIAEVRGAGDSEICQEANARLIAAAPELLSTLQGLVDMCEQGWIPPDPDQLEASSPEGIWNSACEQFRLCGALGLARDTIRKAKGE